MPNPFTHIFINTTILYPFRKHLGKYWIVFSIIGGLLPDIDFAFGLMAKWLGYGETLLGHGGIFHSILFPLILGIISLIIYKYSKEYGKYGFILTLGYFLHLLTDLIIGGGGYSLMILYPFTTMHFRIHLLAQFESIDIFTILDAILLFILSIWIFFKLRRD